MDVGTQLYVRYLQGDADALEQLVTMFSDGVVRFAYTFVHDSALAEDVMEDTFAAVITKRRFAPQAQFKTYLYKIARNKCLDYLRFHKRFVPLQDLDNVGFSDVEQTVEQAERNAHLYKCLQQLPVQYRDVLQLSYLEGFSVEEICNVMHKNTKQVYNLLARAKADLKNILKEDGIFQ